MIPSTVLLLLFCFASKDVNGDTIREQMENLPDFLLEEIIMDSFMNSLSPFPENPAFLTTVLEPATLSERDVGFYLYTRQNPNEAIALKIGDAAALKMSNFDGNAATKILIHGWTDTGNSSWIHDFRRNYLKTGPYNIIIVDWSSVSLKDYLVAARLAKQVGDYISQLVEFLLAEESIALDEIHILGHSLGAHIASFVGNNLPGKIGRITGMDPARPDFETPLLRETKDRLDPSDAKFVDVIHTCAGTAGFVRPIGHADFYPNGGSFRQPGCPVLITQYCSHGRSHQFMAESIINPMGFPAIECYGWKEYKSNKCDRTKNHIVYMGEQVDTNARGIFFLETNVESPYGRGEL